MASEEIKTSLRRWIELDDQARALQNQLKAIRTEKQQFSQQVLEFMRGNNLDNFLLEGGTGGTLSRQVRTVRPALRRDVVRTQLLLQFSDQPERAAAALRAIEGIGNDADDLSVGGVQRELLSRRVPRTAGISLS
jgi:molybdopterin biosynthesis enzyme MoaB